jgi:cytochrome c peroxidase
MRSRKLFFFLALALTLSAAVPFEAGTSLANPFTTVNSNGTLSTFSTAGPVDVTNPFFQDLGSNGRTCNSCHVSSAAWSIAPSEVQSRFSTSHGRDPIFRPVDGATCPSADLSTLAAKKSAYRLLLDRGLIRVSVAVPSNADFAITAIDDPYNCPETTASNPSMYRRPLPSTNLRFLPTVMWDGRESPSGRSLTNNLLSQANDATMGHAQGSALSPEQAQKIVDFEIAMFTAQSSDQGAGALNSKGATGGAVNLSKQDFYAGINDPLGADPKGFNPEAFTLYNSWSNSTDPAKSSIARGEAIFNSFPITITGVAGLNDQPGLSTVNGTCTTCHDSPNVGNHSAPLAINIGVTDYPARPGLDISGLPVYTVRCDLNGDSVQTTDPARALVTGKCADVGKTKGPVLRGLSARAPYFHNGSARTLNDAVEFYNNRFNMQLTEQQKKDLVTFLATL